MANKYMIKYDQRKPKKNTRGNKNTLKISRKKLRGGDEVEEAMRRGRGKGGTEAVVMAGILIRRCRG